MRASWIAGRKQYLASKTDANADMDRLIEWLAANQPQRDETAIAHGDFRIGNTILHPTEPRIIALLDWELATLGHPLADLAYACMYYHMPSASDVGGGLDGARICKRWAFRPRQEFLAIYQRHSGRSRFPTGVSFWRFRYFRMAAITQGVYARALQGNAADQRAIGYGETAKIFAGIGWALAQADDEVALYADLQLSIPD